MKTNSVRLLKTLLGGLAIAPSVALAAPADDAYAAGVEALRAKSADAAAGHLESCVALAPERADCRWELGWAYWLQNDWEAVVETWEAVEGLDPSHPELGRYLPQARDQLALQRQLAAGAAAAPASLSAPPPAGASVRIRAVGDVMLGTDFPAGYLPPNGGEGMLDDVTGLLIDADVTFINLEGPLCDGGTTNKCGPGENCYAFRSPTSYGAHLQAVGVDLASTANNHAEDFGVECRVQTEETLESLGIAYSGRPGTIASIESNGLKIGMIGFHTSNTGHNLNDQDTAVALVQSVDRDHDLVIVSFHGGAEGSRAIHVPHGRETFYGENRGNLREFTHAVVDAGADLVLGHGPHVPRAMEIYNGRLIAYSLGNFATYGRFNLSGHLGNGLVLEATLAADGSFAGGQILSTRQEGEGIPVPDPSNAAADLIRDLSKTDFPETGVLVAADGSIGAP